MAQISPQRSVLTVTRHEGLWFVELEGRHFGHSADKEEAKAAAHKKARQIHDSGGACQIRVAGEIGFGGA